jgi:hypothetical protein
MSNSNLFDQANDEILSMISDRKQAYREAENKIYDLFYAMLGDYEYNFIRGLKQKLDHFDLSFDEFVHRFNRLYGRYHVLYKNRWCHDGDGYEYIEEDFVKEDFRGFHFAVRQHAKKLLKSDYPELVSELFDIPTKYGYFERPYDDVEAEKDGLHSYEYSFSIEKESQRGSS